MSSFFESMRRQLGYVLSLPERTIRSLAAVGSGTTSLLTDTLFPDVLRGTTMYRIFIGDAQRFVVEKVAEVQREGIPVEASSDPNYVPKKMIGGALETAGLFAMHISPLWVFAIAGDAAAGSSVFLHRLAGHLKRNGVIDADVAVNRLDDLLLAMQDSSRRSAAAIDTPPLSRAEVEKLADDMLTSYGQMFSSATNLVPRLDALWQQMERVSARENISLEKLGGILSVDVASWGKRGIGAVLAVGQTGSELLGEQILDGYGRTLDRINEEGVSAYFRKHMSPFLEAAMGHFSPGRKSWTEAMADSMAGFVLGGAATGAAGETEGPAEGAPGTGPVPPPPPPGQAASPPGVVSPEDSPEQPLRPETPFTGEDPSPPDEPPDAESPSDRPSGDPTPPSPS